MNFENLITGGRNPGILDFSLLRSIRRAALGLISAHRDRAIRGASALETKSPRT
jgi:hypothetical protein